MDRAESGDEPTRDTVRGRNGEGEAVSAWLDRLFAGDRRAAAWLYDTFAAELYRRIRGRYGAAGTLEPRDLLHDAFVLYFQHDAHALRSFAARWRPEERTTHRLARHLWDLACGLASNRRRTARRRPKHQPLEAVVLADESGPEQRHLDRDLLAQLEACIERTDELVFLYYTLRYVDGLPPREISAITGWPTATVYRLKQALDRAVADCLSRLGVVDP